MLQIEVVHFNPNDPYHGFDVILSSLGRRKEEYGFIEDSLE